MEREFLFDDFVFNLPKRPGLTLWIANVARECTPKPGDNLTGGVLQMLQVRGDRKRPAGKPCLPMP
jgi:hypothetical protein